ncbi:hypothetical protein FACS1894166_00570 [Bacilli bacterium]|nr:hypothetical protein FACS1894166_00570 [Bacilli bacterium]
MYTFCASFITPDIDDISDIICNSPLKINYSNHTINFDVTVKDIRKVGSFQTTYESNI